VNASVSATASAPLLFRWEAPRHRKLAIAGFLAASTLAHAACFYVFQIIYPPAIGLLPAPARLTLITPSSEEGRTLLRWIEAEDPALASSTQRSPETKSYALPNIQHVPSYLGHEPALKQAPPLIVDLRIPSAQPPGAAPIARPKFSPATQIAPTTVSFSKEMESFGTPNLPSIKFAASTNEPPERVRFRVGISASGNIRYCFPLNSSGDRALDEQAREYLALCRFPARSTLSVVASAKAESNNDSLIWGIATIEWGNDLQRIPTTGTP
jgi:hypothetical protein